MFSRQTVLAALQIGVVALLFVRPTSPDAHGAPPLVVSLFIHANGSESMLNGPSYTVVGNTKGFVTSKTQPDEEDPPVEVVNPIDGEKLDRVADLEGRILKKGWPVVLIKAVGGKSEDPVWHVQPEIEEVKKNRFSARIYVGDFDTPAGKQFKICVVLASNEEEARKFGSSGFAVGEKVG